MIRFLKERCHSDCHLLFAGSKSERLKQYEEHFQTAPESVLKFLKITKSEAEENRESSEKEEKVSDEGEEGEKEGEQEGRKMSRGGVVLSSREKPLEELPNLVARARAKVHYHCYEKVTLQNQPNDLSWLNFATHQVPFKPKTPARTPRNVQRGKEGKKVHLHLLHLQLLQPLYHRQLHRQLLHCHVMSSI